MAVLVKSTSIPEQRKRDLAKFMTAEYMSSEESMSEDELLPPRHEDNIDGDSDSDDDTPHRKKVLVCRPLPWRSQELNLVMQMLDRKALRKRSARSTSMMIERRTGAPSRRPAPEPEDLV